jgi:predicted RNase H-like HicB family nuclease
MARRYRYTVRIIPEEDGQGYYVTVPALPGCFSQGRTIEEVIAFHIRALREDGLDIPLEAPGACQVEVEIAA